MGRADGRDLPSLTGLCAVAATAVLALHMNQAFAGLELGWFARPVELGYLGVDLFFLLSGFVLTHVYGPTLATFRSRAYAVFLGYRIARLYPVHVVVLALLVFMVAAARARGIELNNPGSWRFTDLAWNLLLVHAWGFAANATWNVPSWSISAEWLAYLSFPLWAAVAARCGVRGAGLLAIAALVGLGTLFDAFDWRLKAAWVGAPAVARVLCEFVAGCLIHRAMRGRQFGARGDVAMVAGAIAWLALPLGSYDAVRVAALALVLVGAASARGPLGHLLAARPTVTLGEASYAVYMIHFPIVLVVARLHGAAGIATLPWLVQVSLYVMAVLATWALALAVSAGFERPARRRLRRLVDRWEGASNGRPG